MVASSGFTLHANAEYLIYKKVFIFLVGNALPYFKYNIQGVQNKFENAKTLLLSGQYNSQFFSSLAR